jgi:hypothetical protein
MDYQQQLEQKDISAHNIYPRRGKQNKTPQL